MTRGENGSTVECTQSSTEINSIIVHNLDEPADMERLIKMPSLMPGMPGTKEAYAISVIREDGSVTIPPAAAAHYEFYPLSPVILTTTHRGEGGFAALNKQKAEAGVFKKIIETLKDADKVYWHNNKAYALSTVEGDRLILNEEMLQAFHLESGIGLMSVKSTTVALSFTPVEIWKRKFLSRGLNRAVENISKLDIYE